MTLLRWGNCKIHTIIKAADGQTILAMTGTFDAAATNFSKTKKATWLADTPDNVAVTLMEYDHLISKAKVNLFGEGRGEVDVKLLSRLTPTPSPSLSFSLSLLPH